MMAVAISRCVGDGENVGVGENSPVPTAGVLLARRLHAPSVRLRLRSANSPIPGTVPYIGSKEFFDFAQRGKLDLFFLSGVQIDRRGNLNLHALGDYDHPRRRFPGSFGSAVLYPVVKRVIVFRMEHSPRVFVEKVDFVSAAGHPDRVITPLAQLIPNPAGGELELATYHPGQSVDSVRAATGFKLAVREDVSQTPSPTSAELSELRGAVWGELASIYPAFAAASRARR